MDLDSCSSLKGRRVKQSVQKQHKNVSERKQSTFYVYAFDIRVSSKSEGFGFAQEFLLSSSNTTYMLFQLNPCAALTKVS